jgi:hypothetical protein
MTLKGRRLERVWTIGRERRVASVAAEGLGEPLGSRDSSGVPLARSPLSVPAR